MRTRLLLLALLFSSLGLVAQSAQPSSPSSDNPAGAQTHNPPLPSDQRCPREHGKPPGPSGKVSGGKLIHSVRPEYPPAVTKAHIEGTVVLCATIAKDGTLRNVRAFSGPEGLFPFAIRAVEQWRYQPYLVNNEPVEVDTEMHMGFKLSE